MAAEKEEFNAAGNSLLSDTTWVCLLGHPRCLDCFLWGITTIFHWETFQCAKSSNKKIAPSSKGITSVQMALNDA